MNLTKRNARRPLALAMALAFGSAGTQAATITITDGGDAGTPTTCTVRQALAAANTDSAAGSSCAAGSGVDSIVFSPSLVNSTITLAQGQLQIETSLSVVGSGQTIDAGGNSTVLAVYSTYAYELGGGPIIATISDITVTGGNSAGGFTKSASGSTYTSSGGISTVSAGSPPVRQDRRERASGATPAGTVGPTSSLTLSRVSVVNNTSIGSAGGIYAGGMILNVDQSTVSGNTLVTTSSYGAGGIYATLANGSPSAVTITNSTISGNSASGKYDFLSGGVYAWRSDVTMTNTTIAGNSASGQAHISGGVLFSAPNSAYAAALHNCTVSGNSATTTNGSTSVVGGALVGAYTAGTLTLANSIVAGNTGVTPDLLVENTGNGATASAQSSLLGSALSGTYPGNGNLFSDSPALGALANNGGLTKTLLPQTGSLAIDAGSNALIPAGVVTDQRGAGFNRIYNNTVDMGAVEVQQAVTPPGPGVAALPAPTLSTWAIALLVGLLGWLGFARKAARD